MQYHALAVDYDGTLATEGHVDDDTIEALCRLRQSGRRLILVTGRIIEQLVNVFPQIGLCDLIVADNGAVLYDPHTKEHVALGDPPPAAFVDQLRRRGVAPIEEGNVIVATWEPHESTVLQVIRDLGLELQIIFNKGAVMILPTGVNKATGLRAALTKLGLSQHNTVGIGDAENDEAFLKFCHVSAAVDNALDVVKRGVDVVTHGARGAGVAELIDQILATDLSGAKRDEGHELLAGTFLDGAEFRIPAYGARVLVTGGPGGGKSQFAVCMIEQLMKLEYQVCVIDPEGDYQGLKEPVVLGTLEKAPTIEEVLQVIADPRKSCVVSLFGASHDEQPAVFANMLPALMAHRGQTGRPHWCFIDEAHYPLSEKWQAIDDLPLREFVSAMYLTAYPDQLSAKVLDTIDLFIALGDDPARDLALFCDRIGEAPAAMPAPDDKEDKSAIAWWHRSSPPCWFRPSLPSEKHQRHRHGYLDGELGAEQRFYFRGPKGDLNLAAQNLRMFQHLGEGVDDKTWMYHLQRGDYTHWFRKIIMDDELAICAEDCRRSPTLSSAESRILIFSAIRKKYETAVPNIR